MPIRIAMPIAHVTGAPNYSTYYSGSNCYLQAAEYFNSSNCEGIQLKRDRGTPATVPDSTWDLHAFTDGFLSLQNESLVLRLPRELSSRAVQMYNSGALFASLRPHGPQLRHVVYRFFDGPGAVEGEKIRAILQDANHPGRRVLRVPMPGDADPISLGSFLALDPANFALVAIQFMLGSFEIFVQAGDVIGNFKDHAVELRWLDSCGNPTTHPALPGGRPLNPAYFLHLLRRPANAANVTMLTALTTASPNPPTTTHPLYFLLEQPHLLAAGLNANLGVNLAATAVPPPPLHIRVEVQNAAGGNIAGYGIPMRGLGEWHESRNAPNPFSTRAPVRWRLYGNQAADTNANDFGKFITEVKPGRDNLLPHPNPADPSVPFDHEFMPASIHTTRFLSYWTRYRSIFNRVAAAFDLPVELLVATACTETSTGRDWYRPTFADSHEMDTIRMEQLKPGREPNVISRDPTQQVHLTNYENLTGRNGANANLPVPWNSTDTVQAPNPRQTPNPLTWGELRGLIQTFRDDIGVSPGIMQTLVNTAVDDLGNQWGASFYGAGYVHSLSIVYNGVTIVADDPPTQRDAMFSDWFGVAVDATGTNTLVATSVHEELTKMKRAMHNIIAGAVHLKRRYNWYEARAGNMVTDFDPPTSFSGFNDGTEHVDPAVQNDTNDHKWTKLFVLRYADAHYPNEGPRFYNAAVNYFNTTTGLNPLPAVRLWRG